MAHTATAATGVPAGTTGAVVTIFGGSGIPGGTAAALVALSGDSEQQAVAADLALLYPSPPLDVAPASCTIAERLAESHALSARVPERGELELTIAPLDGRSPLGNGELASCDFSIAVGAEAGTAALEIDRLELRDADGMPVPATGQDGAIVIALPTPTPSVTATRSSTATPTLTPIPVPTDTPSATPTPTETPRFFPTVLVNRFGACAIGAGAVDAVGLASALVPVLLILFRHQRRH